METKGRMGHGNCGPVHPGLRQHPGSVEGNFHHGCHSYFRKRLCVCMRTSPYTTRTSQHSVTRTFAGCSLNSPPPFPHSTLQSGSVGVPGRLLCVIGLADREARGSLCRSLALLQAAPTMSLCDCVAPYAAIPLEGAAGCGVSGWMYPLLSIRLQEKTKKTQEED